MIRALSTGLISGSMLALTHAATPLLGPFALVPLLFLLRWATWREALWAGFIAGLGEASVLAGVMHSSAEMTVAVCLFIACTRALFAVTVVGMGGGRGVFGAPCVAAAWAAWEVAAAHVPYTLPSLLGDTQHTGPWLEFARLGGTYLVAALMVWVASLMAAGWAQLKIAETPTQDARLLIAQVLAFIMLVFSLHLAAGAAAPQRTKTLSVAVVQGGLPTWFYLRSEADAKAQQPEAIYERVTQVAPPAALTIWPETAVWRMWGRDAAWMQKLSQLAQSRGALLVGNPRLDAGGAMFNSAILLGDGDPRIVDKERLAMGAEGNFTPGVRHGPTPWRGTSLGILFCLETVVPDFALRQVRQGAQVLVALVEGSRFGGTPIGRMHAQRSRLRAMESGRAVIHAGQHGYTYVAWPDGSASAWLAPFTADSTVQQVPIYTGITPFAALGVWSLCPLWAALAGAYIARLRRLMSKNSRP